MTPTAALAALVAAVEFMTDSRWYWCRVEDRTRFATALAQAQAVLAQEEHAPPATDPIERLKEALKPALPDRTHEVLAERIVEALGINGYGGAYTTILRAIQETRR